MPRPPHHRPPHRRSPIPMAPEPPRIRPRSPPLKRGRSVDRRGRSPGPPRGKRDIRNNSPPARRRSRSPLERRIPKGGGGPPPAPPPPSREYPSTSKRKGAELSPPPPPHKRRGKGGRHPEGSPEVVKPRPRSKSPVGRDRSSRSRPFEGAPAGNSSGFTSSAGPGGDPGPSGDRFRGGADYQEEKELERPIFRGPDGGPVGYNISELKSITVQILRKNLLRSDAENINRAIVNLEEITPVRRHESMAGYGESKNLHKIRDGESRGMSGPWMERERSGMDNYNRHDMGYPNEGTRPIFERPELRGPDRPLPPVEQRRIVDMHDVRSRSPAARERSRSIGPSTSSRPSTKPYYPADRERERSPYDARRQPSREFADSHEKRGGRYESDLRSRINEKRTDYNFRSVERDRDRDRERDRESHRPRQASPLPPPPRRQSQERRRASPVPSSKAPRSREWDEKDRERDGERKRRPRSREREEERRDGRGSRRHSSSERFPEENNDRFYNKPAITYDQPQEFYEGEEFPVAGSWAPRGRGGPVLRRGIPLPPRGTVFRGGIRRGGFRGVPIMGPRIPFLPPVRGGFRPHIPRGFSPRFFHPFRPFFVNF